MSLKTWRKEFYPIAADRTSQRNALAHSLRKWTGLLASNLKRHGVHANGSYLYDPEKGSSFDIDSSTCALCVHYYDYTPDNALEACKRCPLALSHGGRSCSEFDDNSPFFIWLDDANPRPMLRWLRKAVAWQKKAVKKLRKRC